MLKHILAAKTQSARIVTKHSSRKTTWRSIVRCINLGASQYVSHKVENNIPRTISTSGEPNSTSESHLIEHAMFIELVRLEESACPRFWGTTVSYLILLQWATLQNCQSPRDVTIRIAFCGSLPALPHFPFATTSFRDYSKMFSR